MAYPEAQDPRTKKSPKHQAAAILGKSKKSNLSNAEIAPPSKFDIEGVKERFLYHAQRVWGDNIENISFKFKLRKHKIPMTIAYNSRPQAISNNLVQVPKNMTLYISECFFDFSEEDREKVIIHEVIHIGYSPHNEAFLKQVKKFGGVRSLSELENLGIQLQSKVRKNKKERFKTIETFGNDEIDKARDEMRIYANTHRDEKVRIIF